MNGNLDELTLIQPSHVFEAAMTLMKMMGLSAKKLKIGSSKPKDQESDQPKDKKMTWFKLAVFFGEEEQEIQKSGKPWRCPLSDNGLTRK